MRWIVIVGLVGGCGDNLPASDASVPADATMARLRVSPDTSTFAPTPRGQTSAPFAFEVTNDGTAAAGLIQKEIEGADASAFMVFSDSCTASLAPQESCTIEMTFQSLLETRTARLVMVATPGGEVTAKLVGTPLGEQVLTATPNLWNYGNVVTGQSSLQTFTITNAGGLPAGTLTTQITGTDVTQFGITGTDTCTGMTLAPGTSCMLPITFLPTTAGMKTAVVTVSQSAGASVPFSVSGNATP